MGNPLGQTVKALRERKRLSQRQLAEKVGVTDAYIAMIETGVRSNPSLPLLRRLARALRVSVAELLQ
jgi:transcriptional regulator with XRE-family HTH domain